MGDDENKVVADLVTKAEGVINEKARAWGIPPKLVAAILAIVIAAVGGVMTGRAGAKGNREAYPASIDEVRDAERLRAAGDQLENSYKAAKQQIQQQAQQLVVRAQTRLAREGLTYDFDKSEWFVTDTNVAAPSSASTAAVTSK